MAKEAKSASIELRVPAALKAAAEEAAAKDNRSLASFIEKLLTDHLRRRGLLTEDAPPPAAPRRRSRHYETGD